MKSMKEALSGNPYAGRGIVIGKSEDGERAVFAYFIMGRSENSRNRVFVEEGDGLKTQPFDGSKVKDPSLIIYSPVRVVGKKTIVTNGDQTDTIAEFLQKGKCMRRALSTRQFEPDAPNYTPRISGVLDTENGFTYTMSILKSADGKGNGCNRFTFDYAPVNGLGHFLHTYVTDGNPLPSFVGEPEPVAIPNDIKAFADEIWKALDENNKISLYVRSIDLKSGKTESVLVNKFVK